MYVSCLDKYWRMPSETWTLLVQYFWIRTLCSCVTQAASLCVFPPISPTCVVLIKLSLSLPVCCNNWLTRSAECWRCHATRDRLGPRSLMSCYCWRYSHRDVWRSTPPDASSTCHEITLVSHCHLFSLPRTEGNLKTKSSWFVRTVTHTINGPCLCSSATFPPKAGIECVFTTARSTRWNGD